MIYVSEIMTSQPYTLQADASISDAIQLMSDKHIRHIPIVNKKNELTGIVTHRDLLAATGSKLDKVNTSENALANTPVSEIMTTNVSTTEEQAELISAARFIEQHKFDALPVVADNKVVGIITDSDFVAVAINLLEQMSYIEPDEPDEPYD
jgi:CBS domain-containing protein